MGDYSRLENYIMDYFPTAIYGVDDIEEWAKENVPSWDKISSKDKEEMIHDWEDFVAPTVEEELIEVREEIGEKTPRFWGRIRKFLGKLFGGD